VIERPGPGTQSSQNVDEASSDLMIKGYW